jgi:hypothetical protein
MRGGDGLESISLKRHDPQLINGRGPQFSGLSEVFHAQFIHEIMKS